MSDLEISPQANWERHNKAYLSAALRWLRLRLRRLAASGPPADAAAEAESRASDASGGWFSRRKATSGAPVQDVGDAPTDAEIEAAAAEMAEAASGDATPALHILGQRFGLSDFERDALLLCVALELDTRIAALCTQAQENANRSYPTFALFVALFDDPAWDALSPERPLRYWRLLEINQPAAELLTTSALRADERIVNYVKGLNYLDDRLTPFLIPFDAASESALPPSQQAASDRITQAIRQSPDERTPLIQLAGIDPLSKQLVARHAANRLGLNLYRLSAESLPSPSGELETLARLWHRESILLPIALFLDAHDVEDARGSENTGPSSHRSLQRFLTRSQGVFLLSTRELRSGLHPDVRAVDVEKPTPSEQKAVWREALDSALPADVPREANRDADEVSAQLAGQFNLNALTIRSVVRDALAEVSAESRTAPDGLRKRLWDVCLVRTRPSMDRLAERLRPVATWDDLVLPDNEHALLRQLAEQVAHRSAVYDDWGFRSRMNRGFGISALFAGESGTGKTMAAEVIANELRLALYRIDLSAVVSKYIGETETNLRRLFDAAEDGGAILFFDEADALFGKRSEVRDSHDRYANIEINYLLQRMEAYRGLAILATNMKGALDQAFVRRLRFVVTFPFPGRPEREAIWQRAWPAETPTRDLDYAHLARFSLTGGSIANVALHAAFRASAQGSAVTMPVVLGALRTELRKLERPVNDANLAWDDPVPAADARGAEPTASPSPPDRSPTPAGA